MATFGTVFTFTNLAGETKTLLSFRQLDHDGGLAIMVADQRSLASVPMTRADIAVLRGWLTDWLVSAPKLNP